MCFHNTRCIPNVTTHQSRAIFAKEVPNSFRWWVHLKTLSSACLSRRLFKCLHASRPTKGWSGWCNLCDRTHWVFVSAHALLLSCSCCSPEHLSHGNTCQLVQYQAWGISCYAGWWLCQYLSRNAASEACKTCTNECTWYSVSEPGGLLLLTSKTIWLLGILQRTLSLHLRAHLLCQRLITLCSIWAKSWSCEAVYGKCAWVIMSSWCDCLSLCFACQTMNLARPQQTKKAGMLAIQM